MNIANYDIFWRKYFYNEYNLKWALRPVFIYEIYCMGFWFRYHDRQRKMNRLKYYNYSRCGAYFVTICTKHHKSFFGVIKDRRMFLNEYEKIAKQRWLWMGDRYQRYICLDQCIVMPDHVHGIVVIHNNNPYGAKTTIHFDNPRRDNPCIKKSIVRWDDHGRDNPRVVPALNATSNTNTNNKYHYSRRFNLLSKTINAFKTTSSKMIHEMGFVDFAWQRSFYDRIIRDENELNGIRWYIKNNTRKHGGW